MTLRGDPGLNKSSVTLKALMRALRHEGQGVWVELGNLLVNPSDKSGEKREDLQPGLKSVLSKFGPVFESPVGLTSVKAKDHAIVLKEGTSPINVQLYRYLHI